MVTRRIQLPASLALEPLQQGDLDSVCGVYSIINAIRICLHPDRVLGHQELRQMYRSGLGLFRQTRSLPKLLNWGMGEKAWFELTGKLLKYTKITTGVALKHRHLLPKSGRLTRKAIWLLIERELDQGHPVLISLGGQLDHYSVVVGISAHRLYLFDSSAHKWVARRCLGLDERDPLPLHWITRTGLMVLKPP